MRGTNMAPRSVIITSASGNIGKELIPLLIRSALDIKIILPTTNAEKLRSTIPAAASASEVAIEEGSIQDTAWLLSLLHKHSVDTVFLCLTGTDELFTTCNSLAVIARAGCVQHLIYLSGCGNYTSPGDVKTLLGSCISAHVLVKFVVEQKLLHGEDLPFTRTILGPSLFFTNDLRSKHEMLQSGLSDEPLGEAGVSRVHPGDIALAVQNCILDHGRRWNMQKVMVGSKHSYTGAEIAALWSKALGKEVRMTRDMDAFEGKVAAMMGGGVSAKAWSTDLRCMYEYFGKYEFGMTSEDYDKQVEVLGREPADYEEWVLETGKSWTATD
ncbi:hypothetical protein LTR85_003748 [Meristemomyces frigidus]|nr:hypothetical protein LTR85_003748 [Meristemomyces frigidus]